jgi:hypothetical protein
MLNCCGREANQGYRDIIETQRIIQPPKRASCCGAPFKNFSTNSAWHLTALAVMGFCTGFFTSLLFNLEHQKNDESAEFLLVTAVLTVLSLTSFISQGLYLKNCCTRPRDVPRPLPFYLRLYHMDHPRKVRR